MYFLLQCFDAVDRTTGESCYNYAHIYSEHGAIWTGLTPDRKLQLDPRDADDVLRPSFMFYTKVDAYCGKLTTVHLRKSTCRDDKFFSV